MGGTIRDPFVKRKGAVIVVDKERTGGRKMATSMAKAANICCRLLILSRACCSQGFLLASILKRPYHSRDLVLTQ